MADTKVILGGKYRVISGIDNKRYPPDIVELIKIDLENNNHMMIYSLKDESGRITNHGGGLFINGQFLEFLSDPVIHVGISRPRFELLDLE